ncbi:MAG: CoA-binding protein [Acidimicrobiia bacterium]|nr:CoA-binding protein [Acidimicrobiia bacterium]MDH3470386.1 CoA-binding protein [Acidimicrobiia bacterium]
MKDIIELLRDPETTVAVVGATDNPSKYGARIYRDLKAKGFTVYPVNLTRDTVDGDKAYASITDIAEPPTLVDLVVPPARTLRVLQECLEAGIMNVWVQPGAGSPEVVEFLVRNGFNYLADDACIMVESRVLA